MSRRTTKQRRSARVRRNVVASMRTAGGDRTTLIRCVDVFSLGIPLTTLWAQGWHGLPNMDAVLRHQDNMSTFNANADELARNDR